MSAAAAGFDPARLEALTVAQNRELWAESAGLPFDAARVTTLAGELEVEYRRALAAPARRDFALDGLADAVAAPFNLALAAAGDAALVAPAPTPGAPAVRWRDRAAAVRTIADPGALARLLDAFVARAGPLVPVITARAAALRRLYAAHATTPLDTFARREGTTAPALRALAADLGARCRAPFAAALAALAAQVFGPHEVTTAGLVALHNNRMYEPLAGLFAARDPLADVGAACARLGFDTAPLVLDLEDRPDKYPGAFCFPVSVPDDVRIAVRPASPHHLADMLFHEHGHALHFAAIAPSLPFADRYWIHSGTHETFATLFESLLGAPAFVRAALGLDAAAAAALGAFHRFKCLLTATWLAAAGATVADAWLEDLPWDAVEARFAAHVARFTGLRAPPALARLDQFVARLDPYPLGYVLAAVRVAHWLDALEADGGVGWWADPAAGDAIRARMRAGGAVRFAAAWGAPDAFVRRWGGDAPAAG